MDNNLNLVGEYIFYENEKEIGRSKNLLTKFGKRFLTQFLAGQYSSNSKDIAIGIGNTPVTENDTQLEFEFYRSQINLASVDINTSSLTGLSTYGVVYKTTIPVEVSGIIKEIGLFPNITLGSTDYASNSISTFENNQSWKDSNGESPTLLTTPLPQIGSYYLPMSADASLSKSYFYDFNIDLSGYSSNDSLTIAFYQSDTNLDYVFVRAYSSATDYYEIRYSADLYFGTKIKNLTLSNLYSSGYGNGTPDPKLINKIEVGVKATSDGNTNVLFDGLRINDEDAFRADYGLISRSVITTPITKSIGSQMDIEYRLGLSF